MDKRFLRVYMDINNKCNLRCRMCYFSLDLSKDATQTMSIELFNKIAEQVFPKAISVNLSCAAEPFMTPNFTEYLEIAKKYSIPETVIVTNATLLTEDKIAALITAGVTQLDVSIDGATKGTYQKIRKGSDFDKVISNIRLLQKIKKIMNSPKPYLFLDYALMRQTIKELPDFIRLAKELGADSVRANHLIPFKKLNNISESLVNCREMANMIFDEARKAANTLRLEVKIPENFNIDEPPAKDIIFNKPNCRMPFESMFIISDGRVIPCCWFPLREWCAGDFNHDTFDSIWNGPVFEKLRKRFKDGIYIEYCKNCPVYGNESIKGYVFKARSRKDVINIAQDGV